MQVTTSNDDGRSAARASALIMRYSTLAFDSQGRLFYGYIVVFFGSGNGINGTQMAVDLQFKSMDDFDPAKVAGAGTKRSKKKEMAGASA